MTNWDQFIHDNVLRFGVTDGILLVNKRGESTYSQGTLSQINLSSLKQFVQIFNVSTLEQEEKVCSRGFSLEESNGQKSYFTIYHKTYCRKKAKKYRNFILGWSMRYFRLERSYLHYFEAPHAPEPVGSITRGDISDVKESVQFEGKPNVFELHTKSGAIWFLQATSAEEMVSWMQALVPSKDFQSPSRDQVTPSGFVVVSDSQQPSNQTTTPPTWQGSQGPYTGGQNTPPMHHGQASFDPGMFASGGPLYDPRVHGQVPFTPPPPYTEQNEQQAQPLPAKTGI